MEALSFEIKINQPIEIAIEEVTFALKQEGFGVLTRIDVKATLKEKLGEDFRPYVILGACNPHLAYRALSADSSIGIMLPCNVTVEALSDTESSVQIANPEFMLAVGDFSNNPDITEVAGQAAEKLRRVSELLQE
jgi:uncharacterized protein (DUF302 family)